MRHPPYQLRPNKAVDRLLLVEVVRSLADWLPLRKMRYYGFGGPFLDDFRLLADAFPQLKLVSVESNGDTFLRQKFHKISCRLTLINEALHRFLDTSFTAGGPCIFWLDYANLEPARLSEFERLLALLGDPSVVKITMRAQMDEALMEPFKIDEVRNRFDRWIKSDVTQASLRLSNLPAVVEGMVQIAAQRALTLSSGYIFTPIQSCYYNDGTQMLSVTGVVCKPGDVPQIRKRIKTLTVWSEQWGAPHRIDIPVLSVKERLHVERFLPLGRRGSARLSKMLPYKIDDSHRSSMRKLEQYRLFHRYYPLFAKISI